MQPTRRMRLQSEIHRELSLYFLKRFKVNSSLQWQHWMTLTHVELTAGGDAAIIYVTFFSPANPVDPSFISSPTLAEDRLKQLNHFAPRLRAHLGRTLKTRYTPQLSFKLDVGTENAVKVHSLLQEISEHSVPHDPPVTT